MTAPLTNDGWAVVASQFFVKEARQGDYVIRGRWSKGNPNNWLFDVWNGANVIARGRQSFDSAVNAALDHAGTPRRGNPKPKAVTPDRYRPATLRDVADRLRRYADDLDRAARDPLKGRSGFPSRVEVADSVAEDLAAIATHYEIGVTPK